MAATKFNKDGSVKIERYEEVTDWKGWFHIGYKRDREGAQRFAKTIFENKLKPVRITVPKNEKKVYDIWMQGTWN